MADYSRTGGLGLARVAVMALLWLLQAALIVLLFNAQWLQRQAQDERAAMAAHLGSTRYERLQQRAEGLYARLFVESGAVAGSYARLLPDRSQPGNLDLAPWFFRWLARRLDAFWWLVNQGLYRALLLNEWGRYLVWVFAATCCDGLIRRKIKQAGHQSPSSDRYTLARRALLLLMLLPVVYLSLPVSVAPIFVPLWGGMLALTLALLTSHMQHQI